jgi:hypothetical protein
VTDIQLLQWYHLWNAARCQQNIEICSWQRVVKSELDIDNKMLKVAVDCMPLKSPMRHLYITVVKLWCEIIEQFYWGVNCPNVRLVSKLWWLYYLCQFGSHLFYYNLLSKACQGETILTLTNGLCVWEGYLGAEWVLGVTGWTHTAIYNCCLFASLTIEYSI